MEIEELWPLADIRLLFLVLPALGLISLRKREVARRNICVARS